MEFAQPDGLEMRHEWAVIFVCNAQKQSSEAKHTNAPSTKAAEIASGLAFHSVAKNSLLRPISVHRIFVLSFESPVHTLSVNSNIQSRNRFPLQSKKSREMSRTESRL